MVWATSNRIGCAIHTCHNMNVWGSVWRRAVYLVCNYAPKWVAFFQYFYFYTSCMFWYSHRTAYSFFCSLTSICASSVGWSFILTLHLNIEKMNDFGIQGRKGNNLMCMEQNKKLVFCYCYHYDSFCLPPLCWFHFTLNSLLLYSVIYAHGELDFLR